MPYHKIPRASLHEDTRALEREHEIVTVVAYPPDEPGVADVWTRYCGSVLSEPLEYRPEGERPTYYRVVDLGGDS